MSAKIIKNKVKEFREASALKVAELAKQADLVPQTIAKMEKGLPTSRNSQLKIAKALGKKHEEVFPLGDK
ncbi:MAG: helix-turn-helix domain-containing protein [Nitrospirae bacterium]|nr:helix-turn-helix domain-containing protein [Nitrospirota bacterium]MCL5421410.1 helix-turn-helix domain-containing protein [Nitrospirota bacterium]